MRSKPSRLALSGMAFAETASASTASIHQPALCPDRYRYCTILWDHRHIYVANTGNSTVSVFTISTTGQLTQVGSNFIVTGATTAFNVLADPTGKYLYVLDSPGTAGKVFAFNLDQTTGAITTAIGTTPPATGAGSIGMAIDPTGALLAVDNNADTNISLYKVSTSTGALTISSPATVGTDLNPQYVVFYTAASDQ
jgi:6-phosphogluconolactonase (cycloisomerase 2 family)